MAGSISICSPKHCFPNITNLKIDAEKGLAYIDHIILFNAKEASTSLHKRHILYDSLGNPILTLNKKIMTMHDRWKVFKGESTDPKDLIFSVKRKSMIQWGIIKLEVFLANNTEEDVCDFMVYAGLLKRSCTILPSQSSTAIAKMKKNGGGDYEVNVNPNTDLAFIVTLATILNKTNHVDEVSNTAVQIARTMVDPLDISGLLLHEFGEPLLKTIIDLRFDNNNGGTD